MPSSVLQKLRQAGAFVLYKLLPVLPIIATATTSIWWAVIKSCKGSCLAHHDTLAIIMLIWMYANWALVIAFMHLYIPTAFVLIGVYAYVKRRRKWTLVSAMLALGLWVFSSKGF